VDGEIHFRAIGRIVPPMPAPAHSAGPGRGLWMHVLPWGVPTQITPRGGPSYREWFAKGSIMTFRPVPFTLGHLSEGGVQLGRVVKFDSGVHWLDAVALVDENPVGDAFLADIGGDGGRLPVSIGFKPISSVQYHDGLMRTRVELTEVAIVEAAAYEGAYTYARGPLTSLVTSEMAAAS
jgi:hypothetical protein